MEAKSLRIGNLVYNNGNIVIFYGCETNDLNFICDELKPIPLTEDWLLKMGFEKNNYKWKDGTVSKDMYCKAEGLYDYFLTFTIDGTVFFRVAKNSLQQQEYLREIKHVHQLQNLYFALTNTELTINL